MWFWNGPIEDVIFFVYETRATNTMVAFLAVFTEIEILWSNARWWVKYIVAIFAIYWAVAIFGIKNETTINDFFISLKVGRIVAVFIFISSCQEVTIFIIRREVAILAIFVLCLMKEVHLWCSQKKYSKLSKKWLGEIKIHTIVKWRPVITPPNILIINHVRLIRWIDRNHLIPCFITFSVVKFSLISERESSTLSLIRAKCWSRYEIFLATKYWRNFLIKFEIFICYEKFLTAYAAFFCFNNLLSRGGKSHINKWVYDNSSHIRLFLFCLECKLWWSFVSILHIFSRTRFEDFSVLIVLDASDLDEYQELVGHFLYKMRVLVLLF